MIHSATTRRCDLNNAYEVTVSPEVSLRCIRVNMICSRIYKPVLNNEVLQYLESTGINYQTAIAGGDSHVDLP